MVTLNELQQIEVGNEQQPNGILGTIEDALKSFNTGLSRTFGIPRAISDISGKFRDFQFEAVGIEPKETPNFLPTGEQIQELGSKVGMTFAPGEEPDTLVARTLENIGAAAPIIAALPLTLPILAVEGIAAIGGAVGGKFLQSTTFGQENPELARALGEIGGGITGVFSIPIAKFLAKGGSIGTVFRFLKQLIPGARKRGIKRIQDIEFTPDQALKELERMEKIPEGKFLLPGQAAATTRGEGIARLTKTVEEEVPKVGAFIEKQRITAVNELQKQFRKSGSADDARLLLEQKLVLKADQATKALSRIGRTGDSAALSTRAEKILGAAEVEGKKVIDDLWATLPSGTKAKGGNLIAAMKEELGNITEGGSINQISREARLKLGNLNKQGDLVGGSLFREPTEAILDDAGEIITKASKGKVEAEAKAIHQFYSLLGSEKARLSRLGGQGNKIRIINKLREAALNDLDDVGVGGNYEETIALTKNFHDKFTKGAVGRVLGRARGETPSPVTALEDIVGQGGVKAKENIQQALQASPQVKGQIQEFLKVKFAEVAVNDKTNRIDANSGNAFIKKFDNILNDLFPELKRDLKNAIAKQADVDDFIGVPVVSALSPLQKETTAASFFLGRNPGEEMAALLARTTKRTPFLSELVKMAKTDPTGKAFRGLQSGFTDELLKIGKVDDIVKLSGTNMIKKLADLKGSVLKSELFNKDEYGKLQRIAEVFKKIEIEKGATRFGEGIISDPVSKLLGLPLRWIAARVGGRSGASIGGSLQIANQAVKESQAWAKSFTNDEARQLLIRFVLEKDLARDMLTDVAKLSSVKRGSLYLRILGKAREFGSKTVQNIRSQFPRPVPVAAVAPAVGSFGASVSGSENREQNMQEVESVIELLRQVKSR